MNKSYLKKYNVRFYKTKAWREKREEILERDNYECQMCKAKGRVTVGKHLTVHHIKHYQTYPYLALTDTNLITVCEVCHNKLHPEKSKGLNKKNRSEEIHKPRFK